MTDFMTTLSDHGPRRVYALTAAALLLLLCASALSGGAQTQGAGEVRVAEGSGGGEPLIVKLYTEASQYVKRKFDELAKTGVPYDKELDQRIRQEQRDLALKYAAQFASGEPLRGLDLYYLGMLYNIAEKSEDAAATMRRLLGGEGRGVAAETLDDARAVLIQNLLKLERAEEAERVLAEYVAGGAPKALVRYRYETALANHYRAAKKFERAAAHARESYRAAVAVAEARAAEPRRRDSLLHGAAAVAADSLARAGRRAEAVALLRDLQSFAMRLPSARLYMNAAGLLEDYDAPHEGPATTAVGPGTPAATAPEITVNEWIEQKPTSLASLRGRVVLLDFWATWCGPCRVTIPRLSALQRKYGRRGFVVLGMTTYQGRGDGRQMSPPEELGFLRQFKRRVGATYGFAVADTDSNEENYGVSSFPTHVLLDRRGRVRLIGVGASDGEAALLEATVRKLLDEETMKVTGEK